MSKIIKAAQWAQWLHKDQQRKFTKAPYITHPSRVASRLTLHPVATEDLVCAAWLHDTIEDCGVAWLELCSLFGQDVANYVKWMTNDSKYHIPQLNREARKALDRERISASPQEVKILKLIDRIDNLNEIPKDNKFWNVYTAESLLLLEVLRVDTDLEQELERICRG